MSRRYWETACYTYAVALLQGEAIRPENRSGVRAKAVAEKSEGYVMCLEKDPAHYRRTGELAA